MPKKDKYYVPLTDEVLSQIHGNEQPPLIGHWVASERGEEEASHGHGVTVT